jgi:hypothetical protein
MSPCVDFERIGSHECFVAIIKIALVWSESLNSLQVPFASMLAHVVSEMTLGSETFLALITTEGFFPCVSSYVGAKISLFRELLLTIFTHIWFLICLEILSDKTYMRTLMLLKLTWVLGNILT